MSPTQQSLRYRKVKRTINRLRELQKLLSDSERVKLWQELSSDYCKHCGTEDPGGFCQCENDE